MALGLGESQVGPSDHPAAHAGAWGDLEEDRRVVQGPPRQMESEPGILIFFLSFYLEIILNFVEVAQYIVCTRVDHFLLDHTSPATRKPPNIMNLSHLHPPPGTSLLFLWSS